MSTPLKDLRNKASDAHRSGKHAEAMNYYGQYLAMAPRDGAMWSNLGVLHRAGGRHRMALAAQEKAYALDPDATGTQNNLANILSDLGEYDRSLDLRRALLAQDPDNLNQLSMVGRCLRGQGKYKDAIAFLTDALARFPDDAELKMQLAFAQMADGQYAAGFETYKARWDAGELTPRNLPFPEWQGEPLKGKTVLVMPEQGFGDAIIFARFIPTLKKMGAKVVMLVERPVARLFADAAGVNSVVREVRKSDPIDFWINMMDIAALHFGKSSKMPKPTRLATTPESVARATGIVAPHLEKFRVGVVWSGCHVFRCRTAGSNQRSIAGPCGAVRAKRDGPNGGLGWQRGARNGACLS